MNCEKKFRIGGTGMSKRRKLNLPGLPKDPTYGEELDFAANKLLDKWQQLIEISENSARRYDELAKLVKDSKLKKKWQKRADKWRADAQELRQKTWLIRSGAEDARKQIEELK